MLTINAQVIACSVNHTSAHHYPDTKRFLYYLGNGRYRLHHPERDGFWQVTRFGAKKMSEGITNSEGHFSQISENGRILLPKYIQNKLSLKKGDFLAFVEEGDNILLKKAELRIIID